MHELSIALSIVDGVREEAERRRYVHVEAIHLRLGSLSGVDKDALLFAYPIACEGTLLENSTLQIEQVDGNDLEITGFEIVESEVQT